VLKKDITIVIQGSTLPQYYDKRCIILCVNSIKNLLHNSKIIVSTWENEKDSIPENLQVDKIIYNKATRHVIGKLY